VAGDPQLQGTLLLEEEEAPIDRQELEDQVHDLVENRREVVRGNERPGDLHQDLEDLVLVRDVQHHAFAIGRRLARRDGDRLEAEVLVEFRDRADAGRGGVDQPTATRLHRRGLVAEAEHEGADEDLVPVLDHGAGNGGVVHADAVGGAVVVEDPVAVLLLQVGVPARDREVVQDDVVVVGSPDRGDLLFHVEHSGLPVGFVVDLKHGVRKL
jgi:hypothetical protein